MRNLNRKIKWFLIEYVSWWVFLQPFLILCKLKLRNWEQIPNGPCIMAFNHVSYMDWLLVYAYINKKKEQKNTFYW